MVGLWDVFFFKQKTAYEIGVRLVGSEMCIRDRTEGDLTAGEIAGCFDISKPSVSHHLNVLKSSGLVLDERRGQNIVYSLNMTVFQELMKWFFDFSKGGK